jgi:hypothetical protein
MSDEYGFTINFEYNKIANRMVRGSLWNRILICLRIRKRPLNQREIIDLLAKRIFETREVTLKGISENLYSEKELIHD